MSREYEILLDTAYTVTAIKIAAYVQFYAIDIFFIISGKKTTFEVAFAPDVAREITFSI